MNKGTLTHVLYVMTTGCGCTRAVAYQNEGDDKFIAIGEVAWSPREPEKAVTEAQVEFRWSQGERTSAKLTGNQHCQAQDVMGCWLTAIAKGEEPETALMKQTMTDLAKMAGGALAFLNQR